MSNFVIANEKTLIHESGADPFFSALTYDIDALYYLTAERGFLQVHLPILGKEAVL